LFLDYRFIPLPFGRGLLDKAVKTKNKFYSGLFELYVAAGYLRLGYDVEAIEENQELGMKTM